MRIYLDSLGLGFREKPLRQYGTELRVQRDQRVEFEPQQRQREQQH